jgi:hypothetical protein
VFPTGRQASIKARAFASFVEKQISTGAVSDFCALAVVAVERQHEVLEEL